MDPITLITSAILVGIVAALKPTAEQAVKDGYSGLKTFIQDRYRISLENLEQKPKSEGHLAVVKSDLEEAKATEDKELLEKAQALIEAVSKTDPNSAQTVGIDLERVKVEGSLILGRINAEQGAIGFRGKNIEVKHDMRIDQIDAKGARNDPKA